MCVCFSFRDSRKVCIRPRGAGSVWSLSNTQLCKSAVKNLRYQTQRHLLVPSNKSNINSAPVTQIISITFVVFSPLLHPVGYSSNHSSSTDLSHRRSASGGSASTGIGSILEPSDQQGESRTSPSVHAPERPSTPAKVHRYCFYYYLLTYFLCWF